MSQMDLTNETVNGYPDVVDHMAEYLNDHAERPSEVNLTPEQIDALRDDLNFNYGVDVDEPTLNGLDIVTAD